MDSVANDYKFVSEPPNEYLCPICVEPLLQPFLTECGHYLCYTCRGRLLASGKDQCPECRQPNGAKDARLNKHFQRQVNSLKVRCEHHEEGCQWMGDLMYLKEHLDPSRSSTRCDYILIDCPLGCGKRVLSSAIESHTRTYCSKLEFRLLPIVFRINDFLKIIKANTEWVSQPFYTHPHGYKLCLVVYPNGKDLGKGSHMSVFVGLLKAKHDDQLAWPLEVDVAIELLNWREDKGNHERTVTMNSEYYRVAKNGTKMSPGSSQFIHHLLLSYNRSTNTVYLQNNSIRLRVNTATIHSHISPLVVPAPFLQHSQSICEFTLTEFSKRKQLKNRFFSSFFNTHQHGYKLCLSVYTNGEGSGKGTHVSVYVQILAGDNDDQLQWPFVGDIVVELVNWRRDKGHHIKTLSIGVVSGLDKVTEGTCGMAFGLPQFVSHSSLSYNRSTNTEYLHGDSLHFRIKQVAVYSTPIQLKSSSCQNSVCEFTLYEFSKRKELNSKYYSPLFYTHQQGYKMCIEVYANGDSSGKGTHVTVYVRLIAGDNDSQLQWPFVGDINIMLLNLREDKGHFRKTFPINPSSEFIRILEGVTGKGWGYQQFISHSSLAYDPASNTEYLCNDSLRLRVEQVAVYSTPFPLKVPSWQNSHSVSQSLCEFTLNEFSKRKQFNNTFYGPSFYTHQHGYKMCLKVYANGDGSGKDTHVSVYAQLMAGDNDDHLQWPFVGDIEFVLLNWREDKRHCKNSVSINASSGLVRVLEGDYGKSWGQSKFILHSSLRSTNTEYLLNDSLRLQVKEVAVYSTPLSPRSLLTPSWQDPRIAYQSVCEFTLNNFLKRKQFDNTFYSPPFYSHYKGYKMCLRVFANGEGDVEDVSVFVNIMSGDNDEQLHWPFAGVVELMLLNWIENKGHHEKTLDIDASSGLVRVTEGDLGKRWGYSQFISHSSLRYNRSTNTEYLRNDSLRFRVKQVAVYSTPLLLKTPTWQNPRQVYQSVFECTVNEFTKRKHFSNCFTSAPFYTHQRGYKMCLVVHANGFGNGKNTHVSVFIQIMAGEYDDRLRWPFVGDISIMLLNWRENRRFVLKTINVRVPNRMVRVGEGEKGLVWGFHTFISHSSLRYDRSTNTEYLQDDCLRFRIYKIDVKGCNIM